MRSQRVLGQRILAGWSVFLWEVAVVAATVAVAVLVSVIVLALV